MPAKRVWTREEDDYIRRNYTKMAYKDLAVALDAGSRSIFKRIKELDLPRQKAPRATVDKNYFSVVDKERAYWAGFIAADGCLYEKYKQVSFELQLKDYTQLLKLAQDTGYTGKIKAVNRKCKGWSAQVYIAGVEQWFEDLGKIYNIYPRKSLTLKPPNLVEREHILSYIKGYIDGDGCIGKYYVKLQDRWDWVINIRGTVELLKYIKEQFDLVVPAEKGKKCASVLSKPPAQYVIRGQRAGKALSLFFNLNTPYLNRKWDKFTEENKYEKI